MTWALYTVLAKASMGSASPLTVSFYATLGGLLAVAPAVAGGGAAEGLPAWTALEPGVWLGILYLGGRLHRRRLLPVEPGVRSLDAAIGALFFFVQPVVGALLGGLLLGERCRRRSSSAERRSRRRAAGGGLPSAPSGYTGRS